MPAVGTLSAKPPDKANVSRRSKRPLIAIPMFPTSPTDVAVVPSVNTLFESVIAMGRRNSNDTRPLRKVFSKPGVNALTSTCGC